MRLWTFQPIEIYNTINTTGVYRCDTKLCSMPEFLHAYNWLSEMMTEKIGPAPEGVTHPVWAWYKQYGKHVKPDLRRERFCYGPGNETYVCIEIEIPDEQVVLSDFDTWHCVLSNNPIPYSEKEDERFDKKLENMTAGEQVSFKRENWKRVFNTEKPHPYITDCGWIQATFWELKKENIKAVRFFRTVSTKH